MGMIILKLELEHFSGIYWNFYVENEMESHWVQKDNRVIKIGY
jgi:hypothetical protein